MCLSLFFTAWRRKETVFSLNPENHKNAWLAGVIMVMCEEPDMRIFFLQPVFKSDEKELQTTCKYKWNCPTIETPLALKVLQESHTSLDSTAEFAAKSSGYVRALQSSSFWCLILRIFYVSVPDLYAYKVIQYCLTFQWNTSRFGDREPPHFSIISLGFYKTCSLFPCWLLSTTYQNSYAVNTYERLNVWQN